MYILPRNLIALASVFALVCPPLSASAAPIDALPRDVPPGHWAAGSVKRVMQQHIMGKEVDGRFQGDKPVTRYELAVALDCFVRYIENAHKPLHAEIVQPKVKTPIGATVAQSQALTHLVANGFLPVTSPLTQDGSTPVTAKQLSDALASVTIKLSDRSEAPRKE